MKSAYLYIRVSTDEQKRKGYSLPEQEERLLHYCKCNNIEVKGIYSEDYSAKNFRRPEWKSLLNTLKKAKEKLPENVLFVKWDRFSRNIEYAYQMLGILRNINVQAMAIDQPIDFTIPESTVTLAVYLSMPEAENGRRALNTSDGMRRAKMTGRHIGKAPTGYVNMTAADGKKYIIPKHPEADLIRWCFRKIANGDYPTDQVRKMACKKGLQCEKSNFWRLMRNPIYCGLTIIPAYQNQERQVIKALHEPLISENLFYEVQAVLNKKHRQKGTKDAVIEWFPLRGFLKCPLCHRTLTGSFSKGKYRRYPYYHCMGSNCKARFKAELLNEAYEIKLKKYRLVPGVKELFNHVLTDGSLLTNHEYLYEQRLIRRQIQEQELLISQARKFFLRGEIDADDFRKIKKEYHDISIELNSELDHLNRKLNDDNSLNMGAPSFANLLQWYKNQEIEDKRNIISMITPENINSDCEILGSLNFNEALSKIMVCIA